MAVETQAPHKCKKVAIVGGSKSRFKAPYDDDTWDIWAFSSIRLPTPRITRWFELHSLEDLQGQLKHDTPYRLSYRRYLQFMLQLDCPIYMQRTHEEIPNSVEYPLQAALDAFGKCFTSTVSYLIALAILEGYETIGVWGIRLKIKTIYARQRPGVEYLLGVAKQRGIHIYLPKSSPLHIPTSPVITPTDILYGYDWESPKAWWRGTPPIGKRRTQHHKRIRR
jgi:hypothetical protein